jgi:excisionase family DNA binding protein
MQESWLSVGEIAAHLGVNPDTIYKWITREKTPAHKLGRLWKFFATEVDAWAKGGHAAEDVAPASPAPKTAEPSAPAAALPSRTGRPS